MPSELTRLLRKIDDAERTLKIHRRKIAGLVAGNLALVGCAITCGIFVPTTTSKGGNPLAASMFCMGMGFIVLNIVMMIWITDTHHAARWLRDARYKYQDYMEDKM